MLHGQEISSNESTRPSPRLMPPPSGGGNNNATPSTMTGYLLSTLDGGEFTRQLRPAEGDAVARFFSKIGVAIIP